MHLRLIGLLFALCFCLPSSAWGFTHVVRSGETLASLAERYYGRIYYERILVAANRLDLAGGTPLTSGMRLEIPTVSYYEVRKGDTWATLADRFLGSAGRSDVLSMANGSSPWLIPEEGQRILVPYNLTVLITNDDTIVAVAQRFLGDAKHAWMLTHYNSLGKGNLTRGTVVLVPLTELELTEAARNLHGDIERVLSQTDPNQHNAQRRIASEIPALVADIRNARYVDAVARGNRFLASGVLSVPQEATVQRQLLEAYVALDATGAATAACSAWQKLLPSVVLDPNQLSPKIIEACQHAAP